MKTNKNNAINLIKSVEGEGERNKEGVGEVNSEKRKWII